MRRIMLAAAAMLCLTGFNLTIAGRLAWLGGHWAGPADAEGEWHYESWIAAGDMLVGVGMTGWGEMSKSYEYMRIGHDADGKLTFWGSPQGKPPVPFRLVSMSGREVVFENPAHDFPTRIAYRREGDELVATISGPGGANPQSWRYRRRAP